MKRSCEIRRKWPQLGCKCPKKGGQTAPDEALAWANQVAAQYPEHKLIVLTHAYLTHAGALSRGPASEPIAKNPATTVNTSFEIWQNFVRKQPNSFLILCGHASPATTSVPFLVDRTIFGHWVPALLFDYQNQDNGGNGWIGLLTFHPDDTLEVRVYSPYLDMYADELDPNGFTSHLFIDFESGKVNRLYDGYNLDTLVIR